VGVESITLDVMRKLTMIDLWSSGALGE
jgi:hypothetical protein